MLLLMLLLFIYTAFAKPILDTPAEVKRFPFVTYKKVWTGTPAQVKEATVPAVVITYGNKESKAIVASAAQTAYFLGQWTEDMGIDPKSVRKGHIPSIIEPFGRAIKGSKNLIVIGTKNRIVRKLGLKFKGPTLKVVEWGGRKVLIVGGRNDREVVRAARFLANRVVGFKAGAYKTFFSFVKLRGLIEHGNFEAALHLIKDPSGLSACGKNMSLAAPMMLKFPPEVKKVVKRRNRIMYVELVKALKAKDKTKAVKLWKEAMFTCYQCHQGIGIKRLRKFVPNPEIHSRHQRIAMGFGLVKKTRKGFDCSACHSGRAEIRGY